MSKLEKIKQVLIRVFIGMIVISIAFGFVYVLFTTGIDAILYSIAVLCGTWVSYLIGYVVISEYKDSKFYKNKTNRERIRKHNEFR